MALNEGGGVRLADQLPYGPQNRPGQAVRPSAAPPRVEGLKGLKSSLRALAWILGAINQQGVEVVGKALERALETGNSTPMGLIPLPVREYPYGKV